ncbi:MAG TPA: hypothetical protein VN718_01700 [Rhizomicrobium sp.]|nr:hypothetical protein [Rhizomicrobium sp.]
MEAMHGDARLIHLLELADKGPALRSALLEELAELLAFWPSNCPDDMRAPCEALLARVAREADEAARADLKIRLRDDPALAARVLPEVDRASPKDNLGRTLIEMARAGIDVRARMAEALKLSRSRLEDFLATDHGLALICKRLGLSRAVFSTLAMLMAGKGDTAQCYAALDRYDAVTAEAMDELSAAHKGSVVSFRREPRDAHAS